MRQEHYDNVKNLLDRWAERMSVGGEVGEGIPGESLGAPDARIHTVEDMEIEIDKILVRTVNSAVYELPVLERTAVLAHYGLDTFNVWRASFDGLFGQAIESLYDMLKSRVVC